MKINRILTAVLTIFLTINISSGKGAEIKLTTYEITDIELIAENEYKWYEFPVEALFRHQKTGTEILIRGFWNGDKNWIVRFSPVIAGEWSYLTKSADKGLDKKRGVIKAQSPSPAQIVTNPNYRGRIRISSNGRYFEYSDGTPFLLLSDTDWSINTRRCGLGEKNDGPFYQYLTERKAKGFNTITMKFMRGTGDTQDPECQANEGGYPFNTLESKNLNPEFFRYLDIRMNEIWKKGFITAMPVAWFGKQRCFIELDWAIRLSAYFMNRYGAFSGLVAAGGEYQYAFTSCGWDEESYNKIGTEMQKYNSYKKPLSLHPSSSIERWGPKHNTQSSRAYHNSSWLDHNWIQTGQWPNRLFNIPMRSFELYSLEPAKPVYLSEALYERDTYPDHVYQTRWQPWSAFLNGACGFCYGADGVYGFTDPYDPAGETGMVSGYKPWWESLALEGSSQMRFAAGLLTTFHWWKLIPCRNILLINGQENPLPTDKDITPPHCASIPGELYIVYIPRGNSGNKIEIKGITDKGWKTSWYNPRSGFQFGKGTVTVTNNTFLIPERPVPAEEDWVLVIKN